MFAYGQLTPLLHAKMSVIEHGISSETEVPVIYGLNYIDRVGNQDLKYKRS